MKNFYIDCSFCPYRTKHVRDGQPFFKLAQSFGFMFHYIDSVLSLHNSKFVDNIDLIYPIILEIKDTTEIERFVSYLDVHLEIDRKGG